MNYRSGIPVELTISMELRTDCISLFERFEELNDPGRLRAFTSVSDLEVVKGCIPPDSELKYDVLIKRLMEWGRSPTEPALVILLDALANRYREEVRGKDCSKFLEKLRDYLTRNGSSEQAKDYERLVKRATPDDARNANELAEKWIDEAGDDPDELALRITLAVFNGTAFEVIERAKDDLVELLRQHAPPSALPPSPSAPHVPLMRRLEKAGARETDGKPPDWRRVVELNQPELAGEALSYVWRLNRETKWRLTLVEWLSKYVAGRAAHVRTRAAVAAGRLAVNDYRFVREHILDRWVSANDAEHRMAVGMALGVIARERHLAEETQRLLRQWSASDRIEERWAAVRAYIYVGPYCQPVSEVIARWREVAASEVDSVYIVFSHGEPPRMWDRPLYMSLMDAMVRFFLYVAQLPLEERRRLYTGILEGLHKWVADDKRDYYLGLFMFSMIAQIRTGPGESEGAVSPPLLLQLVDNQSAETEYRRQLAGLFELAMRKGATIVEAKRILCEWLGWANGFGDSQPYETRIETLMKDMIAADGGGRLRGKLVVCLRDCGRNRVAQRILSAL